MLQPLSWARTSRPRHITAWPEVYDCWVERQKEHKSFDSWYVTLLSSRGLLNSFSWTFSHLSLKTDSLSLLLHTCDQNPRPVLPFYQLLTLKVEDRTLPRSIGHSGKDWQTLSENQQRQEGNQGGTGSGVDNVQGHSCSSYPCLPAQGHRTWDNWTYSYAQVPL